MVDAEQDPLSTFSSAQRLNNELKKYQLNLVFSGNTNSCQNQEQTKVSFQEQPMDVFNTDKSVFRAEIRSTNKNQKFEPIEITYIKLSEPARNNQTNKKSDIDLPFSVKSHMEEEENRKFPHHSTADIFYSPEQFKAYRDLGYTLTMHYLGAKCNNN